MTTVYEAYTMDYTGRVQLAANKSGQWFRRSQYRDPRYGYKWGRWTRTGEQNPTGRGEMRRVRLPK